MLCLRFIISMGQSSAASAAALFLEWGAANGVLDSLVLVFH